MRVGVCAPHNSPRETSTQLAQPPRPHYLLQTAYYLLTAQGKLDESAQPLDLSEVTSWSRRLGDVRTAELPH